ncbi:hypothetical protein C8J57DRAFT_1274653 [Mycena rebaudengoi]|nr:hypothetical protein C8J57DRAFT_1274653 [Mycena rebaudengoi]
MPNSTADDTLTEREDSPPLPDLFTRHLSPPASFAPEDEDDFMDLDRPGRGAFIEEVEGIENPVVNSSTTAPSASRQAPTQGSSAFLPAAGTVSATLPASTDRSMTNQTMRSFESRTGTSHSAAASGSGAPLSRTATTSTVVTFDDVAPSDLEIYNQAGLFPAVKGEKVQNHRARTDANELRLATLAVTVQRRISELEERVRAQHTELLTRITEILNAPATNTSTGNATSGAMDAQILRLRTSSTETRASMRGLIGSVNSLVNLPDEVAALSRAVRGLTAGRANTAPVNAHTQHHENDRTGEPNKNKRDAPFAAFGEPSAKRNKPADQDFFDVYLWDVDTSSTTPIRIAMMAMERLGLDGSRAFISVIHARNAPRSVISLRFRDAGLGQSFIDRLRANPPNSMRHLHAGQPAVYHKRAEGKGKDAGPANDPW